jgi:acyl carrier protein
MANQEEPALLDDSWHAPLLQLWRKFLKIEDVSIDDDLFEKGGDSLMAIDLWQELQQLTGRQLPDSILFEASTVRTLARRLSSPAGARQAPVIRTVSSADAKIAAKHGVAADQAHPSFAGRGQSAND